LRLPSWNLSGGADHAGARPHSLMVRQSAHTGITLREPPGDQTGFGRSWISHQAVCRRKLSICIFMMLALELASLPPLVEGGVVGAEPDERNDGEGFHIPACALAAASARDMSAYRGLPVSGQDVSVRKLGLGDLLWFFTGARPASCQQSPGSS
jgi:hypothetical protein